MARCSTKTPVGDHPVGIALAPDGKTLLVSDHYSGEVTLLEVADDKLAKSAARSTWAFSRTALRSQPMAKHGLRRLHGQCRSRRRSISREQKRHEPHSTSAAGRGTWPSRPTARGWPWAPAATAGVTIVDTQSAKGALSGAIRRPEHRPHAGRRRTANTSISPGWSIATIRSPPGNIRLGWVLASRIARVRLDGPARREAMSLDPQGKAIADVHGLALTSDESRLVVSAVRHARAARLSHRGLAAQGLRRHATTSIRSCSRTASASIASSSAAGRWACGSASDDRTVYVANYLDNSVQVVDLVDRKLVAHDPARRPSEPSLARRGEAIFYDARRSLDQWYSCHTCHYEGGTNSVPTDTTNDGSAFTFKTVLAAAITCAKPAPGPGTAGRPICGPACGNRSPRRCSAPSRPRTTSMRSWPTSRPLDQPAQSVPQQGRLADRGRPAGQGHLRKRHGPPAPPATAGPHFTDGEVHDVGLGSRARSLQGLQHADAPRRLSAA